MNVPFVDLKQQYCSIKEEVLAEINDVLENTAYISGKKVNQLEETFSSMHSASYCTAVSTGTDAIHIALKALNIGHGDEVIVPVNTFIATSAAVTLSGAKAVFVDNDESTYNIDVSKIENSITDKTKAIMPVHLYGQPAEMDSIMDIASKHGLYVVEDCSQAHFSEYRNKKAGNFGEIGTFSFYPGKNLGAYGEGGAVLTNNEKYHDYMQKYRQHGSSKKYYHDFEGTNYRLDEIQAGVLNVKLKYILDWTDKRRYNAELYNKNFKGFEPVITPYCPPHIKHVYHLYIVRVKERERLQEFLHEKGIQTALHYPLPLHLQKAYEYLGYKEGDFPGAEQGCKEILSLPMYPELREEQIKFVCDSIKSFYD